MLDAKDRVRVVRAAPGSGKTWLIAEAVRREITAWGSAPGGVALLSFTNTARKEIELALGNGVPHPHIVRTIDAFLFRYVVRPLWKGNVAPRILPPLPRSISTYIADESRAKYEVEVKGARFPIHLHSAHCARMVGDQVQVVFQPSGYGDPMPLDPDDSRSVIERKKEIWMTEGLLTYSDASYLAASALRRYESARRLLARRFPLLVIDEVQDTGAFKTEALRLLLEQRTVRGLSVGDPDQAIYEFAGATPAVFGTFEALEGAESFGLPQTHRCSLAVSRVASCLSSSGEDIRPRQGNGEGGAFLIPHGGEMGDAVAWAEGLLEFQPELCIKVLSRGNAAIATLQGASKSPKYYSPSLHLLDEAVRALRAGSSSKAIERSSMAVSRVASGIPEGVAKAAARLGQTEIAWKKLCADALLLAERYADGISFLDWGHAVKKEIHLLFAGESLPINRPIKAPRSTTVVGSWGKRRGRVESGTLRVPVQTVHAAKGETHDITILFVPRSQHRCPSKIWWGDEGEEKRIAYVAASRPKHWFVLNVSEQSLASLRSEQPEFVGHFTVLKGWDELPQFPLPSN